MASTIKEITIAEEILLRADSKYRYQYTLDELIKSEHYLKEIGTITNIFLSVQHEYSKTLVKTDEGYNKKLTDYHNHLTEGFVTYNLSSCYIFLKGLEEKYFDDELKELMKKLSDSQ
jgi:hypothetical protein